MDSSREAANPKATKRDRSIQHQRRRYVSGQAGTMEPTSIAPSSLLQPRLDLLATHLLGLKVRPVQDPGGV